MKIFNSLTKNKEDFKPLDQNNIKMYVCGPTVYSYPHVGNARSVVIYDLFFRLFQHIFPKITYVRNITDVDDKINKAAKERNISIKELTKEFTDIFHEDMSQLNVLSPTFEPKATENIDAMIDMISKLIENGNAYESEGHVLFDVNSYKDYGRLSNRTLNDMIAGARVEKQGYKKDQLDFVLWKPASEHDDESAIFDSPWSKGRPGWHIECSAMSEKFLGIDFDIHGGGADLQFPHHENEIAQSVCSNKNAKHAQYWVHNGFLTVNGEKMSKSLNNFITVRDLLQKDVEGVVIRYLLLSTHYRKPVDFNDKALNDAKKAINKFYDAISGLDIDYSNKSAENPYMLNVIKALSDDLNTPVAFAILHKIVKDIKKEPNDAKKGELAQSLVEILKFLGFFDKNLVKNTNSLIEVDESCIKEQIELRKKAKKDKNWDLCDKIRDDLLSKYNIILEDKPGGEIDWKFKT